jgi:glucose-6-phosphate isomerase
MACPITLDYTFLGEAVRLSEMQQWQARVDECHRALHDRTGPGADFLGWLDPAAMMPPDLLNRVKDLAESYRGSCEALLVIGIGGSYLGARAVIEALEDTADSGAPVLYAGQNISAAYTQTLVNLLQGRHFAVNVISKSGTTTEPAIAFRIFRHLLEQSVGREGAKKHIIATTDSEKGALRTLAKAGGIATLPVPQDVGGRYSVLSPVGLLPIAFAGIDVDSLLEGAIECAEACKQSDIIRNPAYFYAVARHILFGKGHSIEILSNFEARLHYFAEWWKQLFGESEGKDQTGIFPAAVDFSTDLHSMGQWIQEGTRNIFETFLIVEGGEPEVTIPRQENDLDELNYLAGRGLAEVNHQAYHGASLAHFDGGVPSMTISIPALEPRALGTLIYFFQKACAMSGYLLGVNPFDQPGVDAYKNNMFALLNKPGFEDHAGKIQARLPAASEKNRITFD